tara:strand:- start:1130 stop:1912 length:783 start_codon:yes stop_codon:yes gene_type:complete
MSSLALFRLFAGLRVAGAAAIALLLLSGVASGQELWFAANGGVQFGSRILTHRLDDPLFQTAIRADYSVASGRLFDTGGAVTLTEFGRVRVGLGGGFSVASVGDEARVTAEIHNSFQPRTPLRFKANRPFSRSEKSVYVNLRTVFRFGERTDISFYGGPSYFAVTQELVGEIDLPAAQDRRIIKLVFNEINGNRWGFHMGGGVSHFFNDWLGWGVDLRITRAVVPVEDLLSKMKISKREFVPSALGGVHLMGGLRFYWNS